MKFKEHIYINLFLVENNININNKILDKIKKSKIKSWINNFKITKI